MNIVTSICLSGLLFSCASLAGCSSSSKAQQGPASNAIPVTTSTVIEKAVPVEVRAIGNVQAFSSVLVKSQATGQLTGVHFKEGDLVKKGQLLFTIDRRSFEQTLKQAQADLEKAIASQKQSEATLAKDVAQAKNAEAESRRYQTLFQQGIVSREQYDQYRTGADALDATIAADRAVIETSKAGVQAAQAAVEAAKVQLGYCSIQSPIDGRTGNLAVNEGNLVSATDSTPIVTIYRITPIYTTFSVPESYLPDIKKYSAAGGLKVEASPATDGEPGRQGTLSFVDNEVDKTTGTIQLKATFPNSDGALWPGQFVNVILTLSTEPHALVIPSRAVQTGQQGQFVFVINPDMTAQSKPVVVKQTVGDETVIAQGLSVNERVVTDGQLKLVPGAHVQINTPSPASTTEGAQ